MKDLYDITNMTCSACASTIEKTVKKLNGVSDAQVNLLTNKMQLERNDEKISPAEIITAVEKIGYGATLKIKSKNGSNPSPQTQQNPAEATAALEQKNMKKRLIISFSFLIPLLYVSMGSMIGLPQFSWIEGKENIVSFALLQLLLTLPIVFVNHSYFTRGFKGISKRHPNMDSLVALGATAALVYGLFVLFALSYALGHQDEHLLHRYHHEIYFESAAVILTLITLGKYFESRSKKRTTDAISKLIQLAPDTAFVLKNGEFVEQAIETIQLNDILMVKPGQSIPVDGVITEGSTTLDQSALTGESMPVSKTIGDTVHAATINQSGAIKFKATAVGDDTSLAKIIQLVEEASSSKAPITKLADKISGIFVPVVIVLALITAVVWLLLGHNLEFSLSMAISVLVISCPCALGLAAPVSIMVGNGQAALRGIMFKSAEALEHASNLHDIILDKTGTLTKGKPEVSDIIPAANIPQKELLKIAASIETNSEHPLASAILQRANVEQLILIQPTQFLAVPGLGVKAELEGQFYFAGNLAYIKELHPDSSLWQEKAESLNEEGKTVMYFASEKEMLGLIAVTDPIKDTSIAAVSELKAMNKKVVMLTGDHKKTAETIAKKIGIDDYIAEVMPQDKAAAIKQYQQNDTLVAMVGDGINDAPALVQADIGFAIGAGTDIAIDSADVVLMNNRLTDLVTAIQLSQACLRNIKQNLFWAFIYNIIAIPIASGLFYPLFALKLTPMISAAAMSFSSVFVVSNALRLKRFKSTFDQTKTDPPLISGQNPTSSPSLKLDPKETENSKSEEERKFMMKKEIRIKGMSCGHCQNHVTEALNAIPGVSATVDLAKNLAFVELSEAVDDQILIDAIQNAGYTAEEIKSL